MVNKNFVYLVNPISGGKTKNKLIEYITIATTLKKIPFQIFETKLKDNYEWLIEKIEKEKITTVIIIGGDGTINEILSKIKSCDICIGIIPRGSGNGLAYAAKIPKNYKRCLEIIFNHKTKIIDAFWVNNKFACMLSGIGFDAQVAYDFAQKNRRGLINYIKHSAINYFKAKPYLFEIKVKNLIFNAEAYFISVANSNQFGNNMQIAPKASLNDGLLDVVIIQKMNKLKLPFAILNQMRGGNKLHILETKMHSKKVIYFQTPKITIINTQLAPVHIDGEIAEKFEKLTYKIIPNCIKLIFP